MTGCRHQPHQTHEPWHKLPEGFSDHLDSLATHSASVTQRALEEARLALGREPEMIVDLGPGTGVGTLALAGEFPASHVHGIDISSELLARYRTAVEEAGFAGRVTVHEADLSGAWCQLIDEPVDLVWAALSMHHVPDPIAALQEAFRVLRPGGVVALIEVPARSHRHGGGHGHAHPGTLVNWGMLLEQVGYIEVQRGCATFDLQGVNQDREIWIAKR